MTTPRRFFNISFSLLSSTWGPLGRCTVWVVLLGLGLAGVLPVTTQAQQANTFVVNSTADTDPPDNLIGNGECDTGQTTSDGDKECTLRAALEEAQNNTAVDTIRFDNIPTGGILSDGFATISITASNDELLLGGIDDGVFIDGTTAPGYPSEMGGPIVGIDASNLPDGVDQGLDLDSDTDAMVRVEGISVFGAPDDGIDDRGASRTEIIDCWIGIEPDGTVTPNGQNPGSFNLAGISLRRNNAVVRGNVIAGPNCANGGDLCAGIYSGGRNHVIKGNIVGVDAKGNSFANAVADNGAGIVANEGQADIGYGYDETVPDVTSPLEGGDGNLIAENTDDGILLTYNASVSGADSTGMTIRGNGIYGNGGTGIKVAANLDGGNLAPYDGDDDGDTDGGVNRSQNYPVDISTNSCDDSGAETTVDVTYRVRSDADSTTASDYGESGLKIDFYRPDAGEVQGKTYLGTDTYPPGEAGALVTTTLTTDQAACEDEFLATATDSSGNTSQFTPSATSLPVELAAFRAEQVGSASARLSWETASETGNAGFRVQKAEKGGWSTLAFVEGSGTTSEAQRYRYEVEDLRPGTHRFRLKQVDLDGTTTIHDPVSVQLGMDQALELTAPAPNPLREQASVSFAVKEAEETTLQVYNVLGQKVATLYRGTPSPGEAKTVSIGDGSLSTLPSGAYFLRLEAGEDVAVRQFTVVR